MVYLGVKGERMSSCELLGTECSASSVEYYSKAPNGTYLDRVQVYGRLGGLPLRLDHHSQEGRQELDSQADWKVM